MDRMNYEELDALACAAGTDKASNWHDYMDAYAQFFAPLKDKPIKFLEIGLYQGSSAKLWESYFPNAELHFIDITFENIAYKSGRSHYHLADQGDERSLQQFLSKAGGDFDLILDDGNHTPKEQQTSFQVLFPHLKSGGFYIIEDLHSSYWHGTGPGSTISLLKNLIDHVNYVGARTGRAAKQKMDPAIKSQIALELNSYRTEIRSLTFFSSLVIVEKL